AFVDFPSIEPDLSLKDLAPAVFKLEQDRLNQKMKETVELIEATLLHQFGEIVKHLQDRLTPAADGKKKVLHETALTNHGDLFQQFKKLNVGSNQDLDDLVAKAEAAVKGITIDDLKKSDLLKAEIAADIGKIASAIDPLVAKMPRRSIIKPKDLTHAKSHAA